MSMSDKSANIQNLLLIMIFIPIVFVSFMNLITIGQAFAQQQQTNPEDIVVRRVEVWGLFYKLMVAAFVVGAVVQGSIVYACWRFRESNKKNKPRPPVEGIGR